MDDEELLALVKRYQWDFISHDDFYEAIKDVPAEQFNRIRYEYQMTLTAKALIAVLSLIILAVVLSNC